MAINFVQLVGNVVKDAELKGTPTGVAVLRFTVAVNSRRKNEQGDRESVLDGYFPCVLFGKRASALESYIKKGAKIAVAGRLHDSVYVKDDKQNHFVEIIVSQVELMSRDKNVSQALVQTEEDLAQQELGLERETEPFYAGYNGNYSEDGNFTGTVSQVAHDYANNH